MEEQRLTRDLKLFVYLLLALATKGEDHTFSLSQYVARMPAGTSGYPVYFEECHMYEYQPLGQKLWICAWCKEFQVFRNRVYSLEAKVADVEKQKRKSEMLLHGTLGDKIASVSLLCWHLFCCNGEGRSSVQERGKYSTKRDPLVLRICIWGRGDLNSERFNNNLTNKAEWLFVPQDH